GAIPTAISSRSSLKNHDRAADASSTTACLVTAAVLDYLPDGCLTSVDEVAKMRFIAAFAVPSTSSGSTGPICATGRPFFVKTIISPWFARSTSAENLVFPSNIPTVFMTQSQHISG
ncbi:MAG: hypothetical protein ACREM8_02575, partial [Vulcanimicrobiaceae bacterium]